MCGGFHSHNTFKRSGIKNSSSHTFPSLSSSLFSHSQLPFLVIFYTVLFMDKVFPNLLPACLPASDHAALDFLLLLIVILSISLMHELTSLTSIFNFVIPFTSKFHNGILFFLLPKTYTFSRVITKPRQVKWLAFFDSPLCSLLKGAVLGNVFLSFFSVSFCCK